MPRIHTLAQVASHLPHLNLNDLIIRYPWFRNSQETVYYAGPCHEYHLLVNVLAFNSPTYPERVARIYQHIDAINTLGVDPCLTRIPLALIEIDINDTSCMAYLTLSPEAPPDPDPRGGPMPPGYENRLARFIVKIWLSGFLPNARLNRHF